MTLGVLARIRERQGTLLIGSLVTIVFNGLAVVLYGVGAIIAARALGPSEWGQALWFVTGTTTIALFADLVGIYYSSSYLIARDDGSFPLPVARATVLSYGLTLGTVVGLAVGFIRPIHRAVFPDEHGFSWFVLAAVSIAGLCVVNQARAVLLGTSRFLALGVLTLIKSGGFGVLVVVVTYPLHLRRAQNIAGAHLLTVLATAIFGVAYLARSGLSWPRLRYLKACLRVGWRATSINLMSFLHQRVDQYLVEVLLGSKALGLYGVAVSLGEVLTQLPSMIGLVLFPSGAKDQTRSATARATFRIASFTLLGMCAALIPFAFVERRLVILLFGASFAAAVPLLLAFLPAVAFLATLLVVNPYLSGTGYPLAQLGIMAVGLTVNVVLNLLLLPRFGVMAAPVVSSISYAVWLALALMYLATLRRTRVQ